MRLPQASYNQPGRNSSRLLNCYAQQSQVKGPIEIVGTPGIVSYRVLQAPGRGLTVFGGKVYAAAGNRLYDVVSGLTANAAVGNGAGVLTGSKTLMFAAGVTQLVTDTGYLYDGSVIGEITDTDRPQWAAVDWVDGYVVYVERDTGRWGCSDLNDASSYDSLLYATAEGSPDKLVTLRVSQRDVVLIGRDSTEISWNAGAAGFPFERQAGGFLELGGLARLGVCKADNTLVMLASDRTIRVLRGRTWVKVSQSGVEEALSRYTMLSDCEASSFTWNGNIFAQFRFPTENACWVLNMTSGEWFERDASLVSFATCDGRVWVQHVDGTVGYLSDAVYSEFGEPVIREVTFGSVYEKGHRLQHSQLDLIFRTGRTPVGIEPRVQLDISDDGGETWHSLPSRDMGLIGEYRKVIRWNRMGQARDRVYRCRVSEAAPFHLLDTDLT